ncbi:MAG: acyltransferase family protein [Fretibacterium sp.]|nr:acyltransferase family protein [Fretibacterium sp.]
MKHSGLEKDRVVYLDVLRVAAIFSVVTLHVAAVDFRAYPIQSMEWQISNFYHAVTRCAVSPILFMLSGALFLDPGRNVTIRRLWSKNILRIVTAFVFWSALYALITHRGAWDAKSFWIVFLRGHYHMWFLYAIVVLYILTPFIRPLVTDRLLLRYFLALTFTCAILLPTLQSLPALRLLNELISPATTRLKLNAALFSQYAFYFVLGHCLSDEDNELRQFLERHILIVYALGLFGAFVTIAGTWWLTFDAGKRVEVLLSRTSVFIAIQAVAFFLFVKRLYTGNVVSARARGVITALSALSFGTYLAHECFIILFLRTLKYNVFLSRELPLSEVPLLALLVFGCSLAVSWIIHRVPVLRDYIV